MKTLPKYFAIYRDSNNPLWNKYIKWLNKTYGTNFSGVAEAYYGFGGTSNYSHNLECFKTPVEEITLEYWNECINGSPTPMKETGKLIGYKLTGKVSAEKAGEFLGCSPRIYGDGTFINATDCLLVDRAKEAGVLDIWFEPVYGKHEIVHSVGGKFDVTIEEGKIYHKSSDITNYVKEVKAFADNLPRKLDSFEFRIDDIILSKTGCENKETRLSDWLKLYDVWKKNQ